MQAEDDSLEVLGRSECLELLAAASVGRVIFTDRGLPVVLPVTFMLEDDAVVFRSGQAPVETGALGPGVPRRDRAHSAHRRDR